MMDERAFFSEERTTKPAQLNCPFCRTVDSYELKWMLRRKKERPPNGMGREDRMRFDKAQSYMVLMDDKTQCKKCRRTFDISGIKTMAFL